MNRAAQALADALAGDIRVSIARESYTQAYVRNRLMSLGIPVIWERSNEIRVGHGMLTSVFDPKSDSYEVLWSPTATDRAYPWTEESGISVPVKPSRNVDTLGWLAGNSA